MNQQVRTETSNAQTLATLALKQENKEEQKNFHINGYRLQYWLYALLNKHFGQEVHFHRDTLHGLYEANRHGFEVSTNTQSIKAVFTLMEEKLLEAGYVRDTQWTDGSFIKITERPHGQEKLYVSLKLQETGLDYRNARKPVILVWSNSYWKWFHHGNPNYV
jgi:hypothetical protein